MPRLDPSRIAALQQLFASVPDGALQTLDAALAVEAGSSPTASTVAFQARAERADRTARDQILAPVRALGRRAGEGVDMAAGARPPFDPTSDLWRLLRRTDAPAVDAAVAAVRDTDAPDRAATTADALTALAAERLAEHVDWEPLRARLEAAGGEGAAQLDRLLRLAPTIRGVSARARALSRSVSGGHTPALRLAYRDAESAAPGGGALLMAALAAQLDHPWQALRLVSAVMERPAESFLAGSELRGFGLAVLDDVDARLARLAAFDGAGGVAGGEAAAEEALTCALEMVELEQCLTLSRDGPWGRRVAAAKRELARVGEQRLKDAHIWVDRALPVGRPKLGGRVRGAPRLESPFDAQAVQRALGLLAFVSAARRSAGAGGFGAARAKAVEELDARLDQYAEDLLELLHASPAPQAAADLRARLDAAADGLGLLREPKAAALVRRRAAAA